MAKKEDAIGLVARINSELDKATQKTDKLLKSLGSGAKTVGTGGGGGMMPGSLASVNAHAQTAFHMGNVASGIRTAVGGLGTVAGAAFGMLPDTGAVVSRAGGYYGAAVRIGGGMSRQMLQGVTFGGLAGGLSYAGADADVAAYAGSAFVSARSPAFQSMLGAAGNATKYLNMDTVKAFAAVEQLGAGPGSGNFMSRYGIFTTDPTTGREKTQGQIFSEVAGRLTMGHRKMTEEETLRNLRGGFLGSEIRNSGMTTDQQALFSQFMIEQSRGNYMDLSDPEAMAKMMDKAKTEGNANPFASAYAINTSKTGAMQSAESNYLKAITDATPLIVAMNDAAGEMAKSTLGYAKAIADITLGDSATGGAIGMAGGILQTAAGVGAAMLGGAAVKRLGGMMGLGASKGGAATAVTAQKSGGVQGRNKKTSVAPPAATSTGAKPSMAARAAGPAGLVGMLGGQAIMEATGNEQGSIGNRLGNALSMAGTGAMLGSFLGVKGAAAGALIGGGIGFFTGGETSRVGTGGSTDTTGGQGAFQRPVDSTAVSASYGQKGSVWSAGYHKGTDYPVPIGTPVYAAAAGTVSKAHHGSGSHSFGIYVAIEHPNSYTTIYAHLSQTLVKPGDAVVKGQLIGKSGDTGHVTGPHLHFEVRKNGGAVDPGSLAGGVTGGGESSGAGASKQNGAADAVTSGPGQNILDLVLGRGSSGITPSITLSTSGVKGNFQTTSQLVGSSMRGGSLSVSSPVTAATGSTSQVSAVGGELNDLGLGAMSTPAANALSSGVLNLSQGSNSRGSYAPVVNISVNLANSSTAEAKRLAEMVKSYLEEDTLLSNTGRR